MSILQFSVHFQLIFDKPNVNNTHTYIIDHYNPSVRITAQLLTLHVVCVNFTGEWRDLQLTLIPNDRFFRNFFMAGLFTLRVFARNLLRGSRWRNIFHISVLMIDLGYEPRLLRLISRHTTYDHGDLFPIFLIIYLITPFRSFKELGLLPKDKTLLEFFVQKETNEKNGKT